MNLSEEDHRSKMSFPSHIQGTYSRHDLTVDVDFNHLVKAVFVRLLHFTTMLLPFSLPIFFGKIAYT